MGVLISATRLMQPGEFSLWGNGRLIASGLLGSRLDPTTFDAVALHVDDSAVLWRRLGGLQDPEALLGAIARWWEYEVPGGELA
jgi:hypothetical protein